MSTRLPIARAILEGASCRWTRLEPTDAPSTHRVPNNAVDVIRRSVHFDVQVASDIYFAHPEKEYHLESSFGPMRLPYPDVWMEWQADDTDGDAIEMAAAISERPGHKVNPGEGLMRAEDFRIRFSVFVRIPSVSNDVNMIRLVPYFDVTPEGRYIPGSRKSVIFNDDGLLEEVAAERAQTLRIGCEESIVTTGLALSLMNCKNVTTQESGRLNIRRSGADKRRGITAKSLRYHTIILPGGGSQHEGGSTGTHRASAVHRVRGHFKTFTADAPLMGKHVGTYWWGWQVRGNKDSGMVVSDYKVGA